MNTINTIPNYKTLQTERAKADWITKILKEKKTRTKGSKELKQEQRGVKNKIITKGSKEGKQEQREVKN